MIKRIPFTEWLPDQPDHANGGFETCVNALPADNGYIAGYQWHQTGTSGTLASGTSDKVMGIYALVTPENEGVNFVGTKNEIWELKEGGLGQFTATLCSAGYTSSNGLDYWEFEEFGASVLATNYRDVLQYRESGDLGGSFTAAATAGGTIRARTIASSKNFLIAGNMVDADGTTPNRVRWSAIGDPRDWTVSAVTQADYQDLDGAHGQVRAVFGGEYAVVFMDTAIYRMSYVGPPTIWKFDEVVSGFGLYFPKSAIQVENKIFYYANEGFRVLVNGSQTLPIGYGKVDEWFRRRHNNAIGDPNCYAGLDPERHLVMWTLNATTDENYILAYDYMRDKWGLTDSGVTSDKAIGAYSWGGVAEPNVDADYPSIWFATKADNEDIFTVNNAFGQSREVSSKVGSQYIELEQGRNALVKSAIPLRSSYGTSGSNTTIVSVIGYSGWGDDVGATSSATSTGTASQQIRRFSLRKNGRYHKFFVDWNNDAAGSGDVVSHLDVEYAVTHRR